MDRVSRTEARRLGLKRYFTGKPCKAAGHIAERYVSSAACYSCHAERCARFRAKHPEKHRAYELKSRPPNSDRERQRQREYRAKHRIKRNDHSREYNRVHRKELRARESPERKLASLLRARLRVAIRKRLKSGSAVHDLGCSIPYLIDFIGAQFLPGMTWDNRGKMWQLDHIKPLASFDLGQRKQFLIACHYTNLQPLFIADHRRKTHAEIALRRVIRS